MAGNIDKFLETILLPDILRDKNVKLIRSSYKSLTGGAILVTELYYVHLEVLISDTVESSIDIALKFSQGSGEIVDLMPMQELFQNEITFYKKYLRFVPELQAIVPKFYSGDFNKVICPEYVAIEYLKSFKLSDELFLSSDHVEMALEKLGLFHGTNYALKETDRENFNELCAQFVETRYKNAPFNRKRMLFDYYISATMLRGFKWIGPHLKFPEKLIHKFQNIFQESHKMFCNLVQPKNDLATLCHGDFNRNNLMFEYTADNELKSLKMIDFQMMRYASPAIDLSFFLFMNTHHRSLHENFDKWFRLYHSVLLKTIKTNAPNVDLSKYSLDAFLTDYAQHAIYGYGIITFFLEVMSDDPTNSFAFDPEYETCNTLEDVQKFVTKRHVDQKILMQHGYILNHCLSLYEKYCWNK